MVIIQNVDTSTFKFNGIKYVKNFMCIKQGINNISIINAFDTSFTLLESTSFNQVSVNGIIYTNQTNLISALATLIFSKQIIDSAGLNPFWSFYGSTDNLFNTNIGNVGIGTTGVPLSKLQVSNGNILIDNAFALSTFDSTNTSINKLLFSSNVLSGGAGNNVFLGNNLYNQSVSLFAGGNTSNVNERLSIQGNGYVGIGTISPTKELSMVRKSGTFTAEINSYGSRSDFWLNRASGTYSVPTTPSVNAILGKMVFGAYDSSINGFAEAAKIEATIDSNTSAGDLPTRLAFYTTPDGSNIAQERLRIDNKGNVGVGTISPSARLMVKGESNTSSTNSFKVQNSDGYEALRINDDSEIFLSPLDTDNSQIALLARKSDGKLCSVNSSTLTSNLNLQEVTNNGNSTSNSINIYDASNSNNFSELKYNQLILAHNNAGGGVGLNADYTSEYYRLQAPNKIGGGDRIIATTDDFTTNYVFSHGAVSPLDNTTYFVGDIPDLAPTTVNVVSRTLISQVSGKVTEVAAMIAVGGFVASSEYSTFEIHNLTLGTSSNISSYVKHNLSESITNYVLTNPLTVNAGNILQIKWITPVWAINPTSVRQRFNIIIK